MTDQQAHAALAAYRDATCPGSYLAISHISRIRWTVDQMAALLAVSEQTPTPEWERTPEELRALLTGYTLEPPGLVPAAAVAPRPAAGRRPRRPQQLLRGPRLSIVKLWYITEHRGRYRVRRDRAR